MADDEAVQFARRLDDRLEAAMQTAQAAMAEFLAERAQAGYQEAVKNSPIPAQMRPTRRPEFGRIAPLGRIRPLVSHNPLVKEPVQAGGALAFGKTEAEARTNEALTNQDILSRGDLDAAAQVFAATFRAAIGKIGE